MYQLKNILNVIDIIHADVATLESIYQRIGNSLSTDGLDESSQSIVNYVTVSIESKHGITGPPITDNPQVSMERIKELVSSAKKNAKKAAKWAWKQIVKFFSWARGFFTNDLKKQQVIKKSIEKLEEVSKGSTSGQFDLTDDDLLVNRKVGVKETDINAFQSAITFHLKNNRYTIVQLEHMVENCKTTKPEFFKEHEVDKFSLEIETDKSKWNKHLWLLEQSYLNHNFSMKRLDHSVAMKKYLIENKHEGFELIVASAKDKAAAVEAKNKSVVNSIKETITIVAELPAEEKALVVKQITAPAKTTVEVDYAASFGDMAMASPESIAKALGAGLCIEIQMRSRLLGVLGKLEQLMSKVLNDTSIVMFENPDDTTKPHQDVLSISRDIEALIEYLPDNSTLHIPSLIITYTKPESGGKSYMPAKGMKIDYSPIAAGPGKINLLNMGLQNMIVTMKRDALIANKTIPDKYLKICSNIERLNERMNVDNEVFDWADDWAVKFSYAIIAADKYSKHCDVLYSKLFKSTLAGLFKKGK